MNAGRVEDESTKGPSGIWNFKNMILCYYELLFAMIHPVNALRMGENGENAYGCSASTPGWPYQ